jgi:hypothetical protein
MDHLATQESTEILQLRNRRKQAAERVRALLQQLEIAEREFESASFELAEAESRPGEKARAI